MFGICFVCSGNICRSPTAEGVMRAMVEKAGLGREIFLDSAGMHGYHVGDLPDSRSRRVAAARGYALVHRARIIVAEDYARFDLLLAMDSGHLVALQRRAPKDSRAAIAMFRSFDPDLQGEHDVPDPYYGDEDGFEAVLAMSERACAGLLAHLRERVGRSG
jgi:protein-tyrosine phosphatase